MIDIDKHINKLKRKPGIQTGHIRVMSKIVKDLSSGIYSSPANCIKELINNSFDADASKVIIRAKPSLDLFSITDNGSGMSIEDFAKKFSVISKSYKRDEYEVSPKFKRPLIGKIGIGFIAVSEICDKMIIITKSKGDIGRIKAEIDFKKFKDSDEDPNDEFYKKSEFKLEYQENKDEKNEEYTKVILSELTSEFKQLLTDKDNILNTDDPDPKKRLIKKELEDKKFIDIVKYLRNKRIKTYQHLGEYWRLIFDISRTIPVKYFKKGPIILEKKNKFLDKIKEEMESFNFHVDFDGIILKKPILFPNEDDYCDYKVDHIVHTFSHSKKFENSHLKFSGYIYSQHGGINPKEDAGIIIRVKNVKIGETDSTYLDYPFVSNQLFRHWNFGEIYIEEGLEDAMNIDRNSFRLSHAHYLELKKYIHNYLTDIVFPYCLKGFYEAKRERTEKENRRKQTKKIQKSIKQSFSQISKPVKIEMSNEKNGKAIEIIPKESKVIIRTKSSPFRNFNKKEKELIQEILIYFEAAYEKARKSDNGIEGLRKNFYNSLEKREK